MELAKAALTGPLPAPYAWTKQRPFPHRRLCCPSGSTGTTAASDALLASHPLPDHGYRAPCSGETPQSPGQRGPPQFPPPPSERSASSTPGSSSRLRVQALHRFHGLRPEGRGSALPYPALAGTFTARQTSRDATDRSVAPPDGLSTLHFDAGRFPPTPAACYRAPWRLPGPDFHRLATTSFRPSHVTSSSA